MKDRKSRTIFFLIRDTECYFSERSKGIPKNNKIRIANSIDTIHS